MTALLVVVGLVLLVPQFAWSDGAVQGLALGLMSGFTFACRAQPQAPRRGKRAYACTVAQNAYADLALLVMFMV